ncbi:DUF7521 family protein [Halococcus salsus]|uniref:DUF7521 family protein n=1 Tax=Halococcus salsus TaxID=2162894 RepID=UPI00135C7B54|nr:hypothetical protein [Halococcus salsus]
MSQMMLTIIVLKAAILLLGGGITYIAYRAHRRTGASSLRALAIGFGTITFGALLGGIADQVFNVGFATGVAIDNLLTMLGFAIITYSLYIER